MRFRIWIEQQEPQPQQSQNATSANERVKQLLDMIQKSTVGEQSLKDSLSSSFTRFKKGDNPGSNVIRTAFQNNNVFKMIDSLKLDSSKVDSWLQSNPNAATIGDLLVQIFGKDKIDNVLNKGELTPAAGQGEEESAALTPEQEAEAQAQQQAMQQAAGQQGVDTQPQIPPMVAQTPQSGSPMSPNPAPSPPPVTMPMGLAASVLPIRPMGGMF